MVGRPTVPTSPGKAGSVLLLSFLPPCSFSLGACAGAATGPAMGAAPGAAGKAASGAAAVGAGAGAGPLTCLAARCCCSPCCMALLRCCAILIFPSACVCSMDVC